ncbi:MAG: oligogalacturonate lyase family protein [Colwellia sp.]
MITIKKIFPIFAAFVLSTVFSCTSLPTTTPTIETKEVLSTSAIPKSWIDTDTNHKVVRLSEKAGSRSLYFHQNAYTLAGDKMVISLENPRGVGVVDLTNFTSKKLFEAKNIKVLFVGNQSRDVYLSRVITDSSDYINPTNELQSPTEILAVNVDTGKVRTIATVPGGKIHSINSSETLLIGAYATRDHKLETGKKDARFDAAYAAKDANGNPLSYADAKEVRMNERLEARIPMQMFTVDIQTGEKKVIYESTDWLNHLQFAPSTDDNKDNKTDLIMYSHEGPWHKVDRIWTIDVNGQNRQKMHTRTMNMEIAGHEFFSFSGDKIYYDLQTPRGEDFWLASIDLKTDERIWRHMERDEWSVHFNISRDGKLLAGDGGGENMVAHAKNGKWLYLFESETVKDVAGISADNAKSLVRPAVLKSTKLVNMKDHDYRLEPNITFTPDGKWIVFRSNMHGPVHTYAVSVTPEGK